MRRLLRTPDDKVVAGVCGGLGRYFDIDPVIFRIAFAALTLAGGTGVVVYLVFWVAVPEVGAGHSLGEHLVHHGPNRSLAGVVLLAIAALVIVGNVFDSGFGGALVLMAAGAALLVWKKDERPPSDGGRRDHGAPAGAGAIDDDDGYLYEPHDEMEDDGPPFATSSGYVRYRSDAPVRTRGPRSYLGRLTVGVLLLVAGGFAMGSATGAVETSLETFFGVALLITGAGLLVGARFGRARGLIPLGVVLTLLLAGASFLDVPLRGGMGERIHRPVTADDVRGDYRLLAGTMTIDLSRVRFGPATTEIEASVAAGELIVLVPRGVDVQVDVSTSAGEVDVLGHTDEGVGIDMQRVDEDDGRSARLELDLQVGVGTVEVQRAAA